MTYEPVRRRKRKPDWSIPDADGIVEKRLGAYKAVLTSPSAEDLVGGFITRRTDRGETTCLVWYAMEEKAKRVGDKLLKLALLEGL